MIHAPHPVFDEQFREQFDMLLAWRRDVRRFDDRPVNASVIDELLDRACLAPSVGNAQPWRFVSVRTSVIRSSVADHVEAENRKAKDVYDDSETQSEYQKLKLHGLREAPVHLVCLL